MQTYKPQLNGETKHDKEKVLLYTMSERPGKILWALRSKKNWTGRVQGTGLSKQFRIREGGEWHSLGQGVGVRVGFGIKTEPDLTWGLAPCQFCTRGK